MIVANHMHSASVTLIGVGIVAFTLIAIIIAAWMFCSYFTDDGKDL